MTDDELSVAVARIEGWTLDDDGIWRHPDMFSMPKNKDYRVPPYADDWRWCGPLMERHEVVTSKYQGAWLASSQRVRASEDASLCRAICLAVIAAHEAQP